MPSALWEQLNATMTERHDLVPGLSVMRVVKDGTDLPFTAGQYCVLGLPPDAPRVDGTGPGAVLDEKEAARLVRRAYSIASAPGDPKGLEFYVALVGSGEFTPRLFALSPGDRIWVGPKATGLFTLAGVPAEANLILVSTGTGLAPYMSMLRSELATPRPGRRIGIVHGVRTSPDLGYRAEIEAAVAARTDLSYLPSITRPALDPSWSGETGYLQAQLEDGRVEEKTGIPLDPAKTHVFLCGNPAMIEKAVELLAARGYTEWSRQNPTGQIHLEKYW